jgi:methylase of polypeptide subunit release factors
MTTTAGPTRRTTTLGGLHIAFDERVLRPRPWTAAQSEWAADLLERAPAGPVLELCTGAGHIGLIAILANSRRLVAVDADPVACDFAAINAADAGLADRVEVRNATLDFALAPGEKFPVIIADPPWVPTDCIEDFPEDPVGAIDGGADGLDLARGCLEVAAAHLAEGGVMLLQLGTRDQAAALDDTIARAGLVVTEVRQPAPDGVVVCLRRD